MTLNPAWVLDFALEHKLRGGAIHPKTEYAEKLKYIYVNCYSQPWSGRKLSRCLLEHVEWILRAMCGALLW